MFESYVYTDYSKEEKKHTIKSSNIKNSFVSALSEHSLESYILLMHSS